MLGNGSNDVLELVARAFLTREDSAVYSRHAFMVYPLAVQAIGASGIEVPARDYGNDLDAMARGDPAATRRSSSSPTRTIRRARSSRGTSSRVLGRVPRACWWCSTRRTANTCPASCVAHPGWLGRASQPRRLAHALEGLRARRPARGLRVADPEVAEMMNRVRQPFNVNHLAIVAAARRARGPRVHREEPRGQRAGLEQLARGLRAPRPRIHPLARQLHHRARGRRGTRVSRLLREGVIVRPIAGYGMPEHLRVTVGLPEQNDAVPRGARPRARRG